MTQAVNFSIFFSLLDGACFLYLWGARWDAALSRDRLAAAFLLSAVTVWSLIVSVICLISGYFDISVFLEGKAGI